MNSVRVVTRPLTSWPGELRTPFQRRQAPFTAPWPTTQDLLQREARMIGGRDVVVQLAVHEGEIRRDGWPYARAHACHPGVTVVVPESRHGRLSWSTDRYERWQDNVRAVGLSMEALRAADRHGVMQGRQYAGFRELGSGEPDDDWRPSVEEAAQYIVSLAGWDDAAWRQVIDDAHTRSQAFRDAAKVCHPDVGGLPDVFARLQIAVDVVDTHAQVTA